METKKVFIGVAWPYVNGDIHVGHLAGYLIPCDIFARYCRLRGYDALMVSGTDCHGTPITVEADKRGITPRELVAEYDPKVRELITLYGISYDIFTSTATENHREVTQKVFLNLLENGYITKQTSQQYFSDSEGRFLPDRYVEGECSFCRAKEQRADQCEGCGRLLSVGELINPHSKLTKTPISLKETEHYFFNLAKLQKKIADFVKSSEGHWRDWVWKETNGWVQEGLKARPITRDIDWGVALPTKQLTTHNSQLQNAEHKRFYVWFEAVVGYLSAAIEWSKETGRDWKEFWINPACAHYYFMGKDNLVFHAIVWPGQLLGQGNAWDGSLNLPYFPAINHFLNLESKKFSKSRGVHVDSIKAGEYFGVDAVRFYISSIMPETADANWTWRGFQETVNSELVNTIGNFVHRTLSFYQTKLGGKITISPTLMSKEFGVGRIDEEVAETFSNVSSDLEGCHFTSALRRIVSLSQYGNQYFDQQQPWKLINTNRSDCERVVYGCLNLVYALRMLLNPFLPGTSDKISDLLGIERLDSRVARPESVERVSGTNRFQLEELNAASLKLPERIEPLFRKIEDEDIKRFQNQ